MEKTKDETSYYASAVLAWVKEERKSFFTRADILRWKGEDWDPPYLRDEGLLTRALAQLIDLGAVVAVPDPYGPTVYEVEDPFQIDRLGQTYGNSPFYKASRYGYQWIIDAISTLNTGERNRASTERLSFDDDRWEPLPVNVDDEVVAQAIELSEKAVEVIEASNGYAGSEPEERNSILASLKGTLESIKAGMPSRSAIVHGLLLPLKYVAKKFADAAMGKAAGEAVAALLKWLV